MKFGKIFVALAALFILSYATQLISLPVHFSSHSLFHSTGKMPVQSLLSSSESTCDLCLAYHVNAHSIPLAKANFKVYLTSSTHSWRILLSAILAEEYAYHYARAPPFFI